MITLIADIPEKAREWRNDPRIWKWCRQNRPISKQEHTDWQYRISGDPKIKMFGVCAQKEKTSIGFDFSDEVGVCGLTSIDRLNQSAEFSLYIAPEYQGRGFGKKALLALLDHGFRNENLNRIWGESFEGNPALGLFDSIGLMREGLLQASYYRDGKFINSVITSMLREKWQARR